jgi:monoterpene epsilon-lactone hydrolase
VYEALLETRASERIVVAGESAGGGLTAALLVNLRDDARPLPAAAVVISPWCDLTGLGACSDEALATDFLTPEVLVIFADNYAGESDRALPLCSPGTADLSGLPPLLVLAGANEILCSQDERLAARAKECGVDVTLEVEPDMFHAWPLFTLLPEAQATITRIAAFVQEHVPVHA